MNPSKTNDIAYEQPLRCFFLAQLWEYIQEFRHWQRENVVQLLHTRATDWIIQPQLRENGMGNEFLIFPFDYRDVLTKTSCCSFGFCPNYLPPAPPPTPAPTLDNLNNFFSTPKTSINAIFKMTHYPKFFINKGRILALWVMYTTVWSLNNKDCLTPLWVSEFPFNTLKITILGCTPNLNFRGCKSKKNVDLLSKYVFLGFFILSKRFYPLFTKFLLNNLIHFWSL